jgi:uncharacterized protein (DUF433 family)
VSWGIGHEYLEIRGGGYYVAGSRVSLASVVYAYEDGATVETIRQNFPTLSLEQIHGVIAFYLANCSEVESYLNALESKWDELERSVEPVDRDLQARLAEARRRLPARRP